MSEEKKSVFKEEIKYIILILLFVGGIVFNYFTVAKQVDLNTYRITEVERARAIAWEKYDKVCTRQIEQLDKITKDLLKIKVKLGIDE